MSSVGDRDFPIAADRTWKFCRAKSRPRHLCQVFRSSTSDRRPTTSCVRSLDFVYCPRTDFMIIGHFSRSYYLLIYSFVINVLQVITKYACRTASIWLLTLASVVKCCVIVKPLTYWTLFTERVLNITISLIWTGSIAMTTSWLLADTDPPVQWNFNWNILMSTVSGERRAVTFFKVTLTYVVPGFIMFATYASIFFVVRRHRRSVGPSSPGRRASCIQRSANVFRVSAGAAKKLFVIYISYWLMYGPKAITVIHQDVPTWFAFFADWINLGGAVSNIGGIVSNLGGAVSNAALYVALHQSVREELRKLFRRRLNVVHDVHKKLPIIRYWKALWALRRYSYR